MRRGILKNLELILFIASIVLFAGCLSTPVNMIMKPMMVTLITMILGLFVSYCNNTTAGAGAITSQPGGTPVVPTVSLGVDVATMPEAAGVATFTATLSEVTTVAVSVNLAFSGTATDAVDYSKTGSMINIPAGSLSGSLVITTVDDTLYEPGVNEMVIADIAAVTNGTEMGIQQATTAIIDNDGAPSVTLGVDFATIAETGGVAIFSATLSAASSMDVTVNLALTGTATSNMDFNLTGTAITIPAGLTTGMLSVTAIDDLLYEPGANETIIADISTVTNATENGVQQATTAIIDNDAAPTVTLAIDAAMITEAAGIATVNATLSAASSMDVTVNISISGTATNLVDYNTNAASIIIPAGSTSATMLITAIDDNLYEPGLNEAIVADILTVTNGSESGVQQVITEIIDNDVAPLVSLGIDTATINELASGAATITATLSAPCAASVSVNLLFSGTATDVIDYTKSSAVITIPAGLTTGSATVTALDDNLYEAGANETVIIDISTATNAVENGVQQVTTAIVDNPNFDRIWIQDAYLKASNGQANDFFGGSVSISGDIIAAGASSEDNSNTAIQNTDNTNPVADDALAISSGAVYVFKRNATTGDWSQDAYLKATNAQAGDRFGNVSISGDIIAAGASSEDNSNTAIQNTDNTNPAADNALASMSGAVYVFKRNATTGDWSQDAYLKATNAGMYDGFGNSVSIAGDFIAVGSFSEANSNTAIQNIDNALPAADNALALDSGAVYVFKRNATTGDWSQDAYLKASNAGTSDFFGNPVSISGDFIAVGAKTEDNSNTAIQNTDNTNPVADDALALSSGAVYVFKRNASTGDWSQDAYLKASNAGTSDYFGKSVSISGDFIAVGAFTEANSNTAIQNIDNALPLADNALGNNSGAAYVFKRNTTTGDWSQDAYLKAANAGVYDRFGNSISISGDVIVVGAYCEYNSNTAIQNIDNALPVADNALAGYSGATYVFKRNAISGDWSQDAYLKATNEQASDGFGVSVSISNDFMAVSSLYESNSNTAIQNADNALPVADDSLAFGSGAVYVFKR